MTGDDVYTKLAEQLSRLGMGYPVREDLVVVLREMFIPKEIRIIGSIL